MTNILYEKQGSYLQAKEDVAKAMLAYGDSVEKKSFISQNFQKIMFLNWRPRLKKAKERKVIDLLYEKQSS